MLLMSPCSSSERKRLHCSKPHLSGRTPAPPPALAVAAPPLPLPPPAARRGAAPPPLPPPAPPPRAAAQRPKRAVRLSLAHSCLPPSTVSWRLFGERAKAGCCQTVKQAESPVLSAALSAISHSGWSSGVQGAPHTTYLRCKGRHHSPLILVVALCPPRPLRPPCTAGIAPLISLSLQALCTLPPFPSRALAPTTSGNPASCALWSTPNPTNHPTQ